MPKCNHCRKDFVGVAEFRIKYSKQLSPYCTVCRDLVKDTKPVDGNHARPFNEIELTLMQRYIKKLSKKEVKEKLHISGGVV